MNCLCKLRTHNPASLPLYVCLCNSTTDVLDRGCLRQSLVVGMVAPPIIISSICLHLARDKELQHRLRADPSLINAAVEEFVRLYVPYRGFCRTPVEDFEMHGRTIRAKEPISMTYAAANRDPEVFENPHEFVLNRPNITSHLGFGRGRHRCAGMPLARLYVILSCPNLLLFPKSCVGNN